MTNDMVANEKKYTAAMEEAYGGLIEESEWARLQLSYRKTIAEQFEGAIPSRSQVVKETTGRVRLPRARRQNASQRMVGSQEEATNIENESLTLLRILQREMRSAE